MRDDIRLDKITSLRVFSLEIKNASLALRIASLFNRPL